MKAVLAVFIGGGLGSTCRWVLSRWLNPYLAFFPLGTFAANLLSCILLGLFTGLAYQQQQRVGPVWPLLAMTGFCGGFSTFSTFAMENFNLLNQQQVMHALLYTGVSILLGLSGVAAGLWISQKFI